jgi:hypothetical protein
VDSTQTGFLERPTSVNVSANACQRGLLLTSVSHPSFRRNQRWSAPVSAPNRHGVVRRLRPLRGLACGSTAGGPGCVRGLRPRTSRRQIPAPRLAESPQKCGLSCIWTPPSTALSCPYCNRSCSRFVTASSGVRPARTTVAHSGVGVLKLRFRPFVRLSITTSSRRTPSTIQQIVERPP